MRHTIFTYILPLYHEPDHTHREMETSYEGIKANKFYYNNINSIDDKFLTE